MSKINTYGNAVVITSAASLEDIKVLEKYNPAALTLKGGEDNKEVVFLVRSGKQSGMSQYGIVFDGKTRDEAGLATATFVLPSGHEDNLKEYLADVYGETLVNLGKVEQQIPAAVEAALKARADVMESIQVG